MSLACRREPTRGLRREADKGFKEGVGKGFKEGADKEFTIQRLLGAPPPVKIRLRFGKNETYLNYLIHLCRARDACDGAHSQVPTGRKPLKADLQITMAREER